MERPLTPSQETYDSIVRSILDEPGYRHLRLPWTDFIENARKGIEAWVIEVLEKLFAQPAQSTPFSGGLSTVAVVLSIVALIALVLASATLIKRMFGRAPQLHGILGETITAETTAVTLMEKARAAENVGDIRQAVRFAYIAVLLKMHRARLVFLDEAWTNEELYRYLEKNRFTSLEALREVMEGFNVSWYGHRPLEPAAYDRWQQALEQLWQEVDAHEI